MSTHIVTQFKINIDFMTDVNISNDNRKLYQEYFGDAVKKIYDSRCTQIDHLEITLYEKLKLLQKYTENVFIFIQRLDETLQKSIVTSDGDGSGNTYLLNLFCLKNDNLLERIKPLEKEFVIAKMIKEFGK